MRGMVALGVAVVGTMLSASMARATFVPFQSGNAVVNVDAMARLTGSVTYTANTLTTGTLTIVLNITNDAAAGGFITGLVFKFPMSETAGMGVMASSSFTGFREGPGDSAALYGAHEAGASAGSLAGGARSEHSEMFAISTGATGMEPVPGMAELPPVRPQHAGGAGGEKPSGPTARRMQN